MKFKNINEKLIFNVQHKQVAKNNTSYLKINLYLLVNNA